jgi:hypothetical protein
MTREEIIKEIEDGNYEIKHEEDCSCSFDWRIEGDHIDDGCWGNDCWEGNILYIGDEMIAQSIRYGRNREMLTDVIDEDDIPDEIWDEMRMSDMVEPGESVNNDTHERNRRATLIEWLTQLVDEGYSLKRDNERGFANEFSVILVSPDADPDEINDDWDDLTIDEWANDFFYCGDAVTQDFSGHKVI